MAAPEEAREAVDIAWSDFRRDYGVSPDEETRRRERRAFLAGWSMGRDARLPGDHSDALR
jgi:hypothetical protein